MNNLVADAIAYLRKHQHHVLEAVARDFLNDQEETIEEWLNNNAYDTGTILVTLLTDMRERWDPDLLSDSWIGIVSSAIKAEGLIDVPR